MGVLRIRQPGADQQKAERAVVIGLLVRQPEVCLPACRFRLRAARDGYEVRKNPKDSARLRTNRSAVWPQRLLLAVGRWRASMTSILPNILTGDQCLLWPLSRHPDRRRGLRQVVTLCNRTVRSRRAAGHRGYRQHFRLLRHHRKPLLRRRSGRRHTQNGRAAQQQRPGAHKRTKHTMQRERDHLQLSVVWVGFGWSTPPLRCVFPAPPRCAEAEPVPSLARPPRHPRER